MTVADLMRELTEADPLAVVLLEGCDCINDWDGTVSTTPGCVTLGIPVKITLGIQT